MAEHIPRLSLHVRSAFHRAVKAHCAAAGISLQAFVEAAVAEALPATAAESLPAEEYHRVWLPDELRLLPDPLPAGYLEGLEAAGLATRLEDGSVVLWPD
jgi:hypothetical protein